MPVAHSTYVCRSQILAGCIRIIFTTVFSKAETEERSISVDELAAGQSCAESASETTTFSDQQGISMGVCILPRARWLSSSETTTFS